MKHQEFIELTNHQLTQAQGGILPLLMGAGLAMNLAGGIMGMIGQGKREKQEKKLAQAQERLMAAQTEAAQMQAAQGGGGAPRQQLGGGDMMGEGAVSVEVRTT